MLVRDAYSTPPAVSVKCFFKLLFAVDLRWLKPLQIKLTQCWLVPVAVSVDAHYREIMKPCKGFFKLL
ncbi:hypothetical protein A9267_12180 [Shewanella sp. UCD-FRSSP16_17]|nr:hypothetical protein A9267_12180 [Shewanella sp. UCD-FRSSP16_17]